jgi:Helix-turn-helix domain (DUF4817)
MIKILSVFFRMDYPAEQKVWTVIWYGWYGSPKKVQVEFRKKFGRNARTPGGQLIHNWWDKIFETESLDRRQKKKTRFVFLSVRFSCA